MKKKNNDNWELKIIAVLLIIELSVFFGSLYLIFTLIATKSI